MAKVDPKVFNTDPKHEEERNQFDAMLEGSLERLAAKKKTADPPEGGGGFLDSILAGLGIGVPK